MDKALFYVLVGVLLVLVSGAEVNGKVCKPLEKLDIAFAIDTSASIPKSDFEQVKKFTELLIDSMAKGGTDMKIGLIEFSDKAKPSLWLDDPANKKGPGEVRKRFQKIKQPADNFNTNTHLALFLARTQMLNVTYEEGARCGAAKVLILITDGAPSYPTSAYLEANAVRKQGIHLYVVATGKVLPKGSQKLLSLYFTGGDKEKVFRVDDYTKLKKIVDQIIKRTCKAIRSSTLKKSNKILEMTQAKYTKNSAKARM